MKIAIDIRPIGQQRTGDEVYTLNLIQNLTKIDPENFYYLLTNTKEKKQLKNIKIKIFGLNQQIPENFRIISITPANKFLWTFFLLPFWIKKNKIDLLHVQYITPLFFLGKTKLITTIHDVSFEVFPRFIKKTDLFFLKKLIPLSVKKADKVIAVSVFTKKEIIKYYETSSEKIKTIYNGEASVSFFQNISEVEKNIIVKKYGIKKPFIFHIGTLQPRKNIPFLLESFQFLFKKYKNYPEINNISLYLTGDFNGHNFDQNIKKTLDKIKQQSPKVFKKIKFLGYVKQNDLPVILKMADVAVSTSLYEGFGLPVIEAMTSGTPVISNNKSSLGEITLDAAKFYEEGNLNSLAKNIFEVIMNEELGQDLIRKGHKRSQFFSWKKCAKETLNLYNSLLPKNK